jgi:hypothetical protein
LAFRTLPTFGTFCSIPELFRYLLKRSVPSQAEPMQRTAFHLFPLSFISVDCAVPNRSDPVCTQLKSVLLKLSAMADHFIDGRRTRESPIFRKISYIKEVHAGELEKNYSV